MDKGHIGPWTGRQTENITHITPPLSSGNKTRWYKLTSGENYVAFPCCQTIEISMLLFHRPFTFEKPNNVLLFTLLYLICYLSVPENITPRTHYKKNQNQSIVEKRIPVLNIITHTLNSVTKNHI